MAKTEYEIIWKEGGLFKDGHFILKPKSKNEGGEFIAMMFVFAFILCVLILIAPIWIVLLGFQMVREKRYLAGLLSVLAMIYFYVDVDKHWISGVFFSGQINDGGNTTQGIFGVYLLEKIYIINHLALGLSLGYIIDSFLVAKYGKKFKDNRVSTPQIVIYFSAIFIGFLLAIISPLDDNHFSLDNNITIENEIQNPEELKEVIDANDIVNIADTIKEMSMDTLNHSSNMYDNIVDDNKNIDYSYEREIETRNISLSDYPDLNYPNENIIFSEYKNEYGLKKMKGKDNTKNTLEIKHFHNDKLDEYEVINYNSNLSIIYYMPSKKIKSIGEYKMDLNTNTLFHTNIWWNYNKNGILENKTIFSPENTSDNTNKRKFFRYFTDGKYIGRIESVIFYNNIGYEYFTENYEIESIYDSKIYPFKFIESCYYKKSESVTKGDITETIYYYSPCRIKHERKNKTNQNVISSKTFTFKMHTANEKQIKEDKYDFETNKLY